MILSFVQLYIHTTSYVILSLIAVAVYCENVIYCKYVGFVRCSWTAQETIPQCNTVSVCHSQFTICLFPDSVERQVCFSKLVLLAFKYNCNSKLSPLPNINKQIGNVSVRSTADPPHC